MVHQLSPPNKKVTKNRVAYMLLLYILQNIIFTKVAHIWKICYLTELWDTTISGVNIVPTPLEVCPTAMLISLMVGN
jgi:hypothetical protein